MKNLSYISICTILFISCNRNIKSLFEDSNVNSNKEYILKFSPSFHKDLIIFLEVFQNDSVKLTIGQNQNVHIFDSLIKVSHNAYRWKHFGDSAKALSLIKPNFVIENYIPIAESKKLIRDLELINEANLKGERFPLDGADGIFIYFESISNDEKITHEIWSPPMSSETGKALLSILKYLENLNHSIVEESAEMIRKYLDDVLDFKLISEDPLFVRVLDTPCCPCEELVENFVEKLPKSEIIYLDITNYGFYKKDNENLNCIEKGFHKKYKHIRWIYNEDDWSRFDELFHNEKSTVPNNSSCCTTPKIFPDT